MICTCDIETYTVYFARTQRAKKPHQCCDCGGTINIGERYLKHGGVFDGDFSMSKRCADCDFIIHEVGRTFYQECGGWSCVYTGDLPLSWDDTVILLEDDGFWQHVESVKRIVGMQHAMCESRGGTRKWSLPEWATDEYLLEYFGEDDA